MQPKSNERFCLCDVCKCGHHCCPKQTESEDFRASRDDDKSEIGYEVKDIACHNHFSEPLERNLYSNSTYRQDFKIGKNIAGPPETAKLVGTLKCEGGTMQKETVYSTEFVPWSEQDVKLFQATRKQNEGIASGDARDGMKIFDALELKSEVVQRLRDYYCPPHCIGNEAPTRNCLTAYKDKFNLGPPSKKSTPPIEKPSQPFSKLTNYLLDFIPHKLEPRRNPSSIQPKTNTITEIANQTSFDTTHKNDYIPWSPDDYSRSSFKDPRTTNDDSSKQTSTLNVGVGGPVVVQSNNMMDYRDPLVKGPVRGPRRDEFRPPMCRMETGTTTGTAFPKWDTVPVQIRSKPFEETRHSSDTRCLVTTYQQDFDDLREALCPAKIIERYGGKIRHVGSVNQHEYYPCKKGRI